MQTLFPIAPLYPEGFRYLPQFITVEEEEGLCREVSKMEPRPMQFRGYEAKRKVVSFGQDWNFDNRTLSRGKAIPAAFRPLIEKIAAHLGFAAHHFAELLLTEYPVGSVINWHRDAPPFGLIAGLSLNADCVFKLRPHDKTKQGRKAILSIPVERRSLYVMQGEARENWEHSTAPLHEVRYSITLRTLK